MLTILFVYPTPFKPMAGGVERVTDLLAKRFLAQGYTVLYLHHVHKEELMNYDYPSPVYFFPDSNYHANENVEFYHKFLKKYKVDIIINQCGLFDDSKLYLNIGDNKCKIISVLHSRPMLNYERLWSEELILKNNSCVEKIKFLVRCVLYTRIKRNYLLSRQNVFKYVFNHSDRVCLLSMTYREDFNKYYKEYNQDKIVAIPNPNSFDIEKCKKKKQLLFVGRLTKGEKRPDRLLKIWQRLYRKFPDWEMIIVGDGKERSRLEQQAKKLERISFVGFQSPEKYYREASIFCMTSNFEGWPMSLTEAMSFGTVPILFDSFSAVHDIIEDGKTGILIRPFSIEEYVDKLALLMSDEYSLNQMSENCIKDVVRFSMDNIINQWLSLFSSL